MLLYLVTVLLFQHVPATFAPTNLKILEDVSVHGDIFSSAVFELQTDKNEELAVAYSPGYCADTSSTCNLCYCDYSKDRAKYCNDSYNATLDPCNCPALPDRFLSSGNLGRWKHICSNTSVFYDWGPYTLQPGDQRVVNLADGSGGRNSGVAGGFLLLNMSTTSCNPFLLTFSSTSQQPPLIFFYPLYFFGSPVFSSESAVSFLLCPGSTSWGKSHAIGWPAAGAGGYLGSVTVTFSQIEMPPTRPVTNVSVPGLPDHEWIPTGVETFIRRAEPSLVRFVVQPNISCGILMFQSSAQLIQLSLSNSSVDPSDAEPGIQTRTYPGNKEPGVFYFCEPEGSYIYGWIYVRAGIPESVFFDTHGDWILYRQVADLTAWDYTNYMVSAVTIDCEEQSFTQHKRSREQVSSSNDGTQNLRFIWPSADPTPFFPPPPVVRTSWKWQVSTNVSLPPAVPGKIAIALLLDQRLKAIPATNPFFNNYQFLPVFDLPSCTLKFNGILTSGGEPLIQTIPFDRFTVDSTCDADAFYESTQLISDHLDDLITVPRDTQLETLAQTAFDIDLLFSSKNYLNCRSNVKSSAVEETRNEQSDIISDCVAEFGTPEFAQDPCCSIPGSTPDSAKCVPSRRVFPKVQPIAYYGNISRCPTSQCVQSTLESLYGFENLQRNPITSCYTSSRFTFDKEHLNPAFSCFYKTFGYDWTTAGIPCDHDSECVTRFGSDSICIQKSKTCLPNSTRQLDQFLHCTVTKLQLLDAYVLNEVAKSVNVTHVDVNSTVAQFKTSFPVNNITINAQVMTGAGTCIDPHFPTWKSSNIWISSPTTGCATSYCQYTFVSRSSPSPLDAPLPWDCMNPTSPCEIIPFDAPGTACGMIRCTAINDEMAAFYPYRCQNYNFSGICDGLPECRDIQAFGFDNTTSNGTSACVLPNDLPVVTADVNTCKTTFGCTLPNITDKAVCEASGKCSDRTDPIYAIFIRSFANIPGACFFDLSFVDKFDTQPLVCLYPARSTPFGCMLAPPNITQADCVASSPIWGIFELFSVTNLRWLTPATTEDECKAWGAKCVGPKKAAIGGPSISLDFTVLQWKDTTYNLTSLTNECDGTLEYMFKWTPGKWFPAQPRLVTVQRNQRFSRFPTPGFAPFDFRDFITLIADKSDERYGLILQAETFCRAAQPLRLLNKSVCSCEAGGDQDDCFSGSRSKIVTNLGVACSNDPNPISLPPFRILLNPQSVQAGVCQILQVAFSSIHEFQSFATRTLATVIVRQSNESLVPFAIKNDNNAVIGNVLSDGFTANFETAASNVTNFTLCATLPIPYEERDAFPVLDVAVVDPNTGEIAPITPSKRYGKPVILQQTTSGEVELCVQLSILETNQSYYFIQRANDWEKIERQVFDHGTIIYLGVLLALYSLGLIFSLVKIIYSLMFRGFTIDRLFIIIAVVFVFFIVRVVLFALLISNGIYNTSRGAVDYLLIEFPFILYFFIITNYIILWGMIVRVATDVTFREGSFVTTLNFATTFINGLILAVFLLMIILYETVVGAPVVVCGYITIFDEATSFALIISYRVLFSTFGLILGSFLIYFGLRLGQVLSSMESVKTLTYVRIYVVAIICGGGLIVQAIYLLIVTAIQDIGSNYLSLSFLLCMELLPMLVFVLSTEIEPIPGKGISSFLSTPPSSILPSSGTSTAKN